MEEFKGENILDFMKVYPNNESCKGYLADLKWKDGFECLKCKSKKGCRKSNHSYYCYGCEHVETATANTLFHDVRFGLQKAFCMIFEMVCCSKSISSVQMSKRYGVTQATAWYFMQKVRKAMESSEQHLLTSLVHVDEFVVGGAETGKQGRSYDTKKTKAVIAVELTQDHKVKRVYIKGIEDYSAKSLTPIFEKHISKTATITTDKWSGYKPLVEPYKIEQVESGKGKNFKELHIIVYQVKTWIRTMFSHVSKKHVQSYFNEFCFRINRSQFKETIFQKIVQRMAIQEPMTYSKISGT